MDTFVKCPTCQHKFMVPEGEMGKRQVCPNCQALFVAGKNQAEPALAASPLLNRAAATNSGPPPTTPPNYAKTMLGDAGPAIKYKCPRCRKELEAAVSEAGSKIFCPGCSQKIQVPNAPPPEPVPAPAPAGLNKTMLAADESTAAPPIKFNCPGCKRPLEAPASKAGTKDYCPSCSQKYQVPAASTAGPNRNKTMLARDESAAPAADARGGPLTPAAGGATAIPSAVPITGFDALLTPRNIAIAVGSLLILVFVVPAVIRGGKSPDADGAAKAQVELERLKMEGEQKRAEMERQRQAEQEARRQIEEMMSRLRAQEERMRDEQRQMLRTINDQAKKVEVEAKFAEQQKKLEQEQLEAERKQRDALAEANRKLEESKRALDAVQQKQQTIIHQPPPVMYYPPYHPRYYSPWWW